MDIKVAVAGTYTLIRAIVTGSITTATTTSTK